MEKQKWELTFNQFCQDFLDNCKYKKSYLNNSELWEGKKRDLLQEWENILLKRAEAGSIPEKVIRSYVNIFGIETTRRMFRGKLAEGLKEWEKTQIKKVYRTAIKF